MIVEIIAVLFIGLFVGISQVIGGLTKSAGSGGGAVINVLLIIGLGYNAKESIIITYIFLMGGGLASSIASLNKKTAEGKRLIDYSLVMITLPMMMSGAIFGIIINHFISELIVTIIIIILVVYLIYTSIGKYIEAKRKEKQQGKNQNFEKSTQSHEVQTAITSEQAGQLEDLLKQDDRILPFDKLKVILQIYAYTLIILVCRGGRTFDSLIGLQACSIGSWMLAFLHLFLSLIYTISIGKKQIKLDAQKESLGYVFADPKEKMSEIKIRDGMINGLLTGILGGCVGIGGGMILVPIWLNAGMDRNVATSSTGPLIFFSSSISFFISVLLGKYDSFLMVVIFFLVSFCGSYLVKNLVIYLIQRYKFKLLVLVLLIFMMVLSLIALLPTQYNKYQQNPELFMQFDDFC